MTTPIVAAPDWNASQASPWLPHNEAIRRIEAGARRFIIADRNLTAPPGSCADGACYLIAGGATGAWATHDGALALAVGANAVSGWYFLTVAIEGVEIYVQDENIVIRYDGAVWNQVSVASLADIEDVLIISPQTGDVLVYDSDYNLWINQPAEFTGGGGGGGGSGGSLIGVTKLKRTSAQNIVTGAWRSIIWEDDEFDNLASVDLGASGTDIVVPDGVSWMRASITLQWANNSASGRYVNFLNVTTGASLVGDIRNALNESMSSLSSGFKQVTPGDVLRLDVNSSTETLNIGGTFGAYPELTIEWVADLDDLIAGSGGGGLVLIDSHTTGIGETTVSFSAIPSIYKQLRLVLRAGSTSSSGGASDSIDIQFNGDTGSRYAYARHGWYNATAFADASDSATALKTIGIASTGAGLKTHNSEIEITDYGRSMSVHTVFSKAFLPQPDVGFFAQQSFGSWTPASDDAIDQIDLIISANAFSTDSTFELYGIS